MGLYRVARSGELNLRRAASTPARQCLALLFMIGGLTPTALAMEALDDGVPPGYTVVEGDIILPEYLARQRATYAVNLWPGGIVPYEFDPSVLPLFQTLMRSAMNEWEAVAGVHFIPRFNETDFLRLRGAAESSSFVGKIGGIQVVNIYNWHYHFIMVHELGHALGLWHEQSRTDRDQYIQVNFANIQSAAAHNFDIRPGSGSHGPYDFDSVMHYGRCDFSISGDALYCSPETQTITVLSSYQTWQTKIGQRTHLSAGDIHTMAFLYPRLNAPLAIAGPTANRYLTFAPNNPEEGVAIAVDLVACPLFPASVGPQGWVAAPDADGVARVVSTRVQRSWAEPVIRLADCEILPSSTYVLRAETVGARGVVSAQVTVSTTARPSSRFWGDCVGSLAAGTWTLPNGQVNFDDITATVQAFQDAATAPPTFRVDVHPDTPNEIVNLADVQIIAKAFLGETYPFSDPARCP